jgi:Mannosyltransferase putative
VTSIYNKEFASGWVLLNELLRLNVALPVEVWHRPGELSEAQIGHIAQLDRKIRIRVLGDDVSGWAIKPFAIARSAFEEVLWIDTDNAPIRDPAFLFDDPEYAHKGSLFWRDVSGADRAKLWHPKSPVWAIFGVPHNDSEEFETGQLLINKSKCWPQLGLTCHFNAHGKIYYKFVYGDKDTFRLAWQRLDFTKTGRIRPVNYLEVSEQVPYGFMPYGPFHMGKPNRWSKWGGGSVMVQRDRRGKPLFNHRTLNKFALDRDNVFNDDVINEERYHRHLLSCPRS